MTVFGAVFLGILQGFTEFLPVSSSGHLVLAQKILPNFSQPGILFDVMLHFGTLFSVLIYFRREILKIKLKYVSLLIVGTIPAVLIGYFFSDFIEGLFTSVKLVGFALLATGVINLFSDRFKTAKKRIGWTDSLIIGIFQAIAIIPGVSRSGSTIFGGLARKIERKNAARFSFLLSIPAILGANVLQFVKHGGDNSIQIVPYSAGFLAAFASGVMAIYLVFSLLEGKKFRYFGYYCFIAGLVVLIL